MLALSPGRFPRAPRMRSFAGALLVLFATNAAAQFGATRLPGQSRTQLPDGRYLLLGGESTRGATPNPANAADRQVVPFTSIAFTTRGDSGGDTRSDGED